MTGNEYQAKAMRTNDGLSTVRLAAKIDEGFKSEGRIGGKLGDTEIDTGGVIYACLGLSGEVGETVDMIKKWIFHEKELDTEHLQKEIGDVMWYIACICYSFGYELDDIMQMNIDKHLKRYPNGFNTYDANHRKEGDV